MAMTNDYDEEKDVLKALAWPIACSGRVYEFNKEVKEYRIEIESVASGWSERGWVC